MHARVYRVCLKELHYVRGRLLLRGAYFRDSSASVEKGAYSTQPKMNNLFWPDENSIK